MKNVIQQYIQLNSLFVMVTQENISIRNKLMESGNFLKHNQFFSLRMFIYIIYIILLYFHLLISIKQYIIKQLIMIMKLWK